MTVAWSSTSAASSALQPPRPPIRIKRRNPYERRNPYATQTKQSASSRMGLQSQHTGSQVKACKKAGTQRAKFNRRLKQTGIGGREPFIRLRDCKVCKAHHLLEQGISVSIPHRSHHKCCPKNRKTRGGSARSVEIDKIIEHNIRINNAAPVDEFGPTTGTSAAQKYSLWETAKTAAVKKKPKKQDEVMIHDDANHTIIPLGMELRRELDRRINALNDTTADDHDEMKKLKEKANCPLPIAFLFQYIDNEIRIKRKKSGGAATTISQREGMENRHLFFPPRSAVFKFPIDTSVFEPSPYYHSIEGQEIFSLDWEAIDPLIKLRCPQCRSPLKRTRSNFSHNRNLFPLIKSNGSVMWGSVMNYKCDGCTGSAANYSANHPLLLASIDPHISEAYPVEPKYAVERQRFHLTRDATDDLEDLMLSTSGGDQYMKKLYRCQTKAYVRKVHTYATKTPPGGQNFGISFSEWVGKLAPSGKQLRDYYKFADRSPLNPYGYSNFERYSRELQSVGMESFNGAIAIDWTFAALKTYFKLEKAKAIFTMKISTGENALVVIVPSTKVGDISHALIQMVTRRSGFRPRVLYTDEWPTKSDFWHNIFGKNLIGRLGLFHLMHRIVDTFGRVSEELFWRAMTTFKACFYRIEDEDETNLMRALENGTLNGREHSNEDIMTLKYSKRWKLYSKYLRKRIFPGEKQQQKLSEFVSHFKYCEDEEGRRIFTATTEDAIYQQYDVLEFACDPPGYSVYREVKAGPNSDHGLSTWISERIESAAEKFHHLLRHFGNIGMNTELADGLILRGTTEDNTRQRYKNDPKDAAIPGYLEGIPKFWDHALLFHVNGILTSKKLSPVFQNVRTPTENNGEVFVSTYLKEELERKKKCSDLFDVEFDKCNCPLCINISFPLIGCAPTAATPTAAANSEPESATPTKAQKRKRRRRTAAPAIIARIGPTAIAPTTTAPTTTAPTTIAPLHPLGLMMPMMMPPVQRTFQPVQPTVHCRCMPYPPYYCRPRQQYQNILANGKGQKAGRPPNHDFGCPLSPNYHPQVSPYLAAYLQQQRQQQQQWQGPPFYLR